MLSFQLGQAKGHGLLHVRQTGLVCSEQRVQAVGKTIQSGLTPPKGQQNLKQGVDASAKLHSAHLHR